MPAEDGGGRRCNCCFRFIITSGFSALFLWLSLRTNHPTLSIEDFSVFALNNQTTTSNDRTIFFDLKLKNRNKDKGVYYDALNLTFSYNNTAVANATFPPFYQGHEHSSHRPLAIQAEAAPARWMPKVGRDGVAVFRVELATGVRYKVVFWRTKRKKVRLGADLPVNGEGKLVRGRKKGVKLTSGARCYPALPFWVVVVPAALWWVWGL